MPWNHISWLDSQGSLADVANGLVVELVDYNPDISESQFTKLLIEQGFKGGDVLWQRSQNRLRLVFDDRNCAELARTKLDGSTFWDHIMTLRPIEGEPARAAVAASDPRRPAPALGSIEPRPAAWKHDTDDSTAFREAFHRYYEKLAVVYEPYLNRFELFTTGEGETEFLCRQYPNWFGKNDEAAKVPQVMMVKSSEGATQYATVAWPDVSEHLSQGWNHWAHPTAPTKQDQHWQETRECERLKDLLTNDRPYDDTKSFLKKGLALAAKMRKRELIPGSLLGNPDKSRCLSYMSFANSKINAVPKDPRSATIRGHSLMYPRPGQVSLGWGQYDTVTDWQRFGRHVKLDLLSRVDPVQGDDDPAVFTNDGDEKSNITIRTKLDKYLGCGEQTPETLRSKMDRKKKYTM